MKQLLFTFLLIAGFLGEISGLQKESAHYIFYFESSYNSIVDTVASMLQVSYNRITDNFVEMR